MTTIADDNTPYKRLVQQSAGSVPNASAGGYNLFIDSSDGALKTKNSSGVVSFVSISTVSDEAYGSGWSGVTGSSPSKNAVYDKIESMGAASDWNSATVDTATRVSNTTFTTTTDLTAIWQKGFKLKFTDTTTKYAYVVGLSAYAAGSMTVTIAGDALVGNPSSFYVSTMAVPLGFPGTFTSTVTTTGWSGTPTQSVKWSLLGSVCTIWFSISGTSNATSTSFVLPIPATTPYAEGVLGLAQNNTAYLTVAARLAITGTDITFYTNMSSAAWTGSGTKEIRGTISYII
jgi:hypothetical protein